MWLEQLCWENRRKGTKQFPTEQEIPMLSCEEEAYLDYATTHVVDEVFIHVDAIQKQEDFLKKMILEFEKMGVVVALNLDLFDLGLSGEKRIDQPGTISCSRIYQSVVRLPKWWCWKRLMDIVGALAGLAITLIVGIVLAPFLLLESPGPLIFKQKRVGVNGRIFDFYKFLLHVCRCRGTEERTDEAERDAWADVQDGE